MIYSSYLFLVCNVVSFGFTVYLVRSLLNHVNASCECLNGLPCDCRTSVYAKHSRRNPVPNYTLQHLAPRTRQGVNTDKYRRKAHYNL